MFTVYLAGPMTGLTVEEMTAWRHTAKTRLEAAGFRVLTPVRGQLTGKNAPPPTEKNLDSWRPKEWRPIGRTASAFVSQDRLYVKASDIVLAYLLGAERASIGTIWECAWADAWDKMLISVVKDGDPSHDHAFVRRNSSVFVPTLEEALEYLEGIAVDFG